MKLTHKTLSAVGLAIAASVLTIFTSGCGDKFDLWQEEEDKYSRQPSSTSGKPDKPIQVGAYYIPRTVEETLALPSEIAKGTSRFPEQFQPKVPVGPIEKQKFAHHAKEAANQGVDAFVVHWYCNSDGPYGNEQVEQIKPRKLRSALRYALIWKNDHEGSSGKQAMTGASFRKVIDHLVDEHFSSKSYWKVGEGDGVPYFSIYDLKLFVSGFGDMDQAKRSLRMLRNRTSANGHIGLHLNGTTRGLTAEEAESYRVGLELDSLTHYNWIDTGLVTERPGTDYAVVSDQYFAALKAGTPPFSGGYAASVSMGWDPAPLWSAGDEWKKSSDYPYGPVLISNNPARFTKALEQAKAYAKETGPPFVLIHAYNDWLHGSYLGTEDMYKERYLEGVHYEFIDKENIDLKNLLRWRAQNR